MTSLRDQAIRTIKRQLWKIEREWKALVEETMRRAEAQEKTEEYYLDLVQVAKVCLVLFRRPQSGEVVTEAWAKERDFMLARLEILLDREHTKNEQEEKDE